MKIICTTSNKYLHLLKISCYLFNKNWSSEQQVEIVGYDKPEFELPPNFTFYSLGKQTDTNKDFSNDLRKYFEKQDDWFIWYFDDTFLKSLDLFKFDILKSLIREPNVGRINLTYAGRIQDHFKSWTVRGNVIIENTQTARYRICTQISLWNRKFLLQYLKPNMSPWDFESQDPKNDGWRILGLENGCIEHNEGVTRHDIHKYNLKGIREEQIQEMKELGLIP